ncbi:hypothetical protein [Streptomyces sp. NPDC007205]|uniref:hypothetical protein n=1 Tax=Streptomyces sp. NPDC007205 TaxID=3154316 RepID=UPI003404FB12
MQVAERQDTSLPDEKLTAQMAHTLAREVMALNQQVAELDTPIEARFPEPHLRGDHTSMPGLGVILGAEFLARIACVGSGGMARDLRGGARADPGDTCSSSQQLVRAGIGP